MADRKRACGLANVFRSPIRALIESGSLAPRTRKEGESGFVKLAVVVNQSKKGRIDFGYAEEGRFRLSVTYGVANLPQDAANEV
jgi:hypothetical protein